MTDGKTFPFAFRVCPFCVEYCKAGICVNRVIDYCLSLQLYDEGVRYIPDSSMPRSADEGGPVTIVLLSDCLEHNC